MTTTSTHIADGQPTILIVDDEAEILVALTDLLEDDYRILSATSPAAALDLLEAEPTVSVIVSDQRMPDMPGNVFLARARKICSAEAILLTGYADLAAVVSAVNEGAISGYAHKPWEPEALRAMIASAAERHRLRAALLFEQQVFTALSEQGPDAVAVLDAGGHQLRANARMRERLAARTDAEATAAESAADADALASQCYGEEERSESGEAGDHAWYRTRRIPFEADGKRYLLKIESDETARRIAEQKLHQAEKLQALGTLAGGIAHDFNNLLAVVIGNLDLATRFGSDPARLKRYIASATDAANRGSSISRRLLAFSRQRDLAAKSFQPDEAIRDVADLANQTMAGRAEVRLDLGEALWPVRADPGQFELAIVNLCINARDAMPSGGEVVISATNCGAVGLPESVPEADYVRVSVRDTGTGMSEELQARVFEPFFTTKPHGQGTGLGLPMVRSMVEAAGGCVTIDSVIGEGTTIHMWLPRDAEPAVEEDAPAPPPAARRLRILIAEDDPDVRATLSEQLSNCGHGLTAVDSAQEAILRLEQGEAVDLLVTDFAMPGLSGLELAEKVAERWPALPVLIVSGFAEFEPEEGVSVLVKPFTSEQLQTAVEEAVARKRKVPETTDA